LDLSTLLNAVIQGAETGALAQVTPGVSAQPGANGLTQSGPGVQPSPSFSAAQAGPSLSAAAAALSVAAQQRVNPAESLAASAFEDVYHGSGAPASASLLAQSGVGAYVQLLNALAGREQVERSANQLTNNLASASADLKSSYATAVSKLPAPLQQKDWGFSMADGELVFTAGNEELSAQDLADLQNAFNNSNVASAARQVAIAITSIVVRQKAGADPGALAWGRLAADESNFSEVVNLRAYVTQTAPGGRYHPGVLDSANSADPTYHPQIPILLGGMDLRELVSAKPKFFSANGSVATDPLDDTPDKIEELNTLHGQCACGEVRFTVEDAFEYAFYCHCSRCRLRTGSAFAAIAGIGIDKVQLAAGRELLLI